MSAKLSPLNFADHGHLKITAKYNYAHVSEQQVLPLIVHEFANAATQMPVVFVKNSETGEFQPVAIMGFQPGENVFFSEDKWRGNYVPAYATHHPFALVPHPQDETQLQIIIAEDSPVVTSVEGDALFDDKGNETEYLGKRKQALGGYYENMHITKAFTQLLLKHELLVEKSLTVDLNGDKANIAGLYLVDEKKFNGLSDEAFLEFRKKGFLAPIYSHLASMHQLRNLAALKTSKK